MRTNVASAELMFGCVKPLPLPILDPERNSAPVRGAFSQSLHSDGTLAREGWIAAFGWHSVSSCPVLRHGAENRSHALCGALITVACPRNRQLACDTATIEATPSQRRNCPIRRGRRAKPGRMMNDGLIGRLRQRAAHQPGLTDEQRHQARALADGLERSAPLGGQPAAVLARRAVPAAVRAAWLPTVAFTAGAAVAVGWLGRYDARPAGPRGAWAWVHDRWAGTVELCSPGGAKCSRTFPPRASVPERLPDDLVTPPEPPCSRQPS